MDATPLIYRDAWGFLSKAESFAAEKKQTLVTTYARAAIINAVIALEAFINAKLAVVEIEPDLDKKIATATEEVLTRVPSASPFHVRRERLAGDLAAFAQLEKSGRFRSGTPEFRGLQRDLLDLSLEFARTLRIQDEWSERLHRLSQLENAFRKREIVQGSIRTKWLEGLELLTLERFQKDDEIVRRFDRLVTYVRGKRMHERPDALFSDEDEQAAGKFLEETSADEARSACETARSMIAGFYLAAQHPCPQWVNEVHDNL